MIQNIKDFKAVKGYDVVSYFTGKPMQGNEQYSTMYHGAQYLFYSQENKELFLKNPEKYIPAFGGFCAIAMTEGSIVDAHPKAYIIQDGRLLMFYALSFLGILFSDTRPQWKKDPEKFINLADEIFNRLNK